MILNILVTVLKRQFPDVSNISTNELQDVMGKSTGSDKLLIIDTRKREEYDVSFIPGAKHLAFPISESDVQFFAKENISVSWDFCDFKTVKTYHSDVHLGKFE